MYISSLSIKTQKTYDNFNQGNSIKINETVEEHNNLCQKTKCCPW